MYRKTLPVKQLTAWLCAAMIPVGIQLLSGSPWLGVLLTSLVCYLCVCLRWQFGSESEYKIYTAAQWIFMIIALSALTRSSVKSWPEGGHKAVALILLALGAWSAWKGPSAAARVGCALFWFIIILYPLLMGAAIRQTELQWLVPYKGETDAIGALVLLTPAAAGVFLKKNGKGGLHLWLPGFLCSAAAALTAGVLSPWIASIEKHPFYHMIRSLHSMGKTGRLEAMLSAAGTLGWFLLLAMYLSLCGNMAENLMPGKGNKGILISATVAAILLLLELPVPGILLLISAAFLWVVAPICNRLIQQIKKSEKSEKSA